MTQGRTTTPSPAQATARSLRLHAAAGVVALIALVGGVGGWATTSEIAGAVIASGSVVVDNSVKKVQHPTGGVIGAILVRDGDRVHEGDIVLRLDETLVRANLAMVTKALDELVARDARLVAERDDGMVVFPESLTARQGDADVAKVISSETKLFELRRTARIGQKNQLRERIRQIREEIDGLTGQAAAKRREVELVNRELGDVRELWRKHLTPLSRLMALEREAVRIEGERHQLVAAAAQSKGRITETELQVIQIDQDLRSEVARELREIQAKTAELTERRTAAEDQLRRIDIRAPISGVVHQLGVHTLSGVVGPGDTLMLIVPEGEKLSVEARVSPQQIDQVAVGQAAMLRFAAFNQRTTPEVEATVSLVSADITQDQKTGATYYNVRMAMTDESLARLEGLKLVPGMPVEAFIRTESRTVVSYLLKPLEEQAMRAFRER